LAVDVLAFEADLALSFVWATCLCHGLRAGLGPPCRPTFCCQKVGKEPGPYCPRPFGFACGQPAPTTSCCYTAQLAAFPRNSAQTRCRKSDGDAVALFGATARNKRPPSQAWAQGAIPNADSQIASLKN